MPIIALCRSDWQFFLAPNKVSTRQRIRTLHWWSVQLSPQKAPHIQRWPQIDLKRTRETAYRLLRPTSHVFFQTVPQHQSYQVACQTNARAQTKRVSARQCDRKLRAVVIRPMCLGICPFFSASFASESKTWVFFLSLGTQGGQKINKTKCKKHNVVGQHETWHLRLGVWKRLGSDLAGWGPDTSFHFLWMCHCEELGTAAAASIARATARAAKLLHFPKLLCKWRRRCCANPRSKQRVGGKSLLATMDAFSQAGPATPPPMSFAHPANSDASSPKTNFSSSSWEGHTHNTNGAPKAACRHLNRCA